MGDSVEILLSVEERGWHEAAPAGMSVEMVVERAVHAALSRAAPRLRGGEVSIVLASDERVRELNRDWRGQDKPTNVLSFPGGDPDDFEDDDEEDEGDSEDEEDEDYDGPPPMQLGDVILAWPTVAREARDQGKPVASHLTHLVVHGILHLLGFDHQIDDEDAGVMERLETDILAGLGIADPYAEPGTSAVEGPRQS